MSLAVDDIKPGFTFVWKTRRSPVEHLHIVIAIKCEGLQEDECIVVNLTESTGGERALTLHKGDHAYIYKDSDVNFGDSEIMLRTEIVEHVDGGAAITHDRMSMEIVRKIGLFAKDQPAVMTKIRKVLAKKYPGLS